MQILVVLALVVGSWACSSEESGTLANNRRQVFWPEIDMNGDGDALWQGMDLQDGEMIGPGRWRNRFWLRFDGGSVARGESFIVNNAGLTELVVPAFAPSDLGSAFASDDRGSLIETVVNEVKIDLDEVDVEIWTEQPDTEPYSIVYVGGANFTSRDGTLGIAPLDIGNFSGSDILFVFPKEYSERDGRNNLALLAQTITHEITHSLGGRHIDNDSAIMNPIVRLDAKFLDREGPVVSGDGVENTKNVLLTNVGKRDSAKDITGLPKIVDLAIISEGSVAQLSVFALANFDENPTKNLSSFDYSWSFNGLTASGPTVRLFVPNEEPSELQVTVTNETEGLDETFSFMIGRTKRSEQ